MEFVSGMATKKSTSEDEKKRKSKWDQTLPSANSGVAAAILTNVPTGTKTAIPAFGTLPKKSKNN